MVEAAGIEPEPEVDTTATLPPQNPHTIVTFPGTCEAESDTSRTLPVQNHDTSRHEKCAISVQRPEILDALNDLPSALKSAVLNWNSLSSDLQRRILELLEETV